MSVKIKDPVIIIPLLLVSSIALGIVLSILNSVVYVDPALMFAVMLIVILVVWSVLNRWEGERQRQRIEAESRKKEDEKAESDRGHAVQVGYRLNTLRSD